MNAYEVALVHGSKLSNVIVYARDHEDAYNVALAKLGLTDSQVYSAFVKTYGGEPMEPPKPEPVPETIAEAASNALAVLEYTLMDCAEDDRGRMEPAAKRLRAALERETNRAGDLDREH